MRTITFGQMMILVTTSARRSLCFGARSNTFKRRAFVESRWGQALER